MSVLPNPIQAPMTKLDKLKKQVSDLQDQIVHLEDLAKKAELANAPKLRIEMTEVTTKFVMREIPRYCPGCYVDLSHSTDAHHTRGINVGGYSPTVENWLLTDENIWTQEESLDVGDLSYVTSVSCAQCDKVLVTIKEK